MMTPSTQISFFFPSSYPFSTSHFKYIFLSRSATSSNVFELLLILRAGIHAFLC